MLSGLVNKTFELNNFFQNLTILLHGKIYSIFVHERFVQQKFRNIYIIFFPANRRKTCMHMYIQVLPALPNCWEYPQF